NRTLPPGFGTTTIGAAQLAVLIGSNTFAETSRFRSNSTA
ncbi:unnamed protein product, partial [Rotaria magnacalcarata]